MTGKRESYNGTSLSVKIETVRKYYNYEKASIK